MRTHVRKAFADRFGAAPRWLVCAPGRVNLIGEHTDYNDGFVLPMAIARAVWIALRPRDDDAVHVYALDYGEEATFTLSALTRGEDGWIEYIKGCAWALQAHGLHPKGWEGVVVGTVPRGAGLSSSAALELATLRAFAAATGFAWVPAEMARLGQRAENEWVGVNCGIMDQMISAAGREGHALLIDCRTLAADAVPLPEGTAVVVLDTATRRGLVDSVYNERRRQCEAAAAVFGVPALRDVSPEAFAAQADRLDPLTRRRARHVVTENARTLAAAAAMRAGNAVLLGRLMNQSHASLRDDFEVSSDALDLLAHLARETEGCYGARMTGAGFGGCAVALVEAKQADAFTRTVAEAYAAATGQTPACYITGATGGAALLEETSAGGSVRIAPTGFRVEGRTVHTYTLTARTGLQMKVMTYGGIVLALHVPDQDGHLVDVALGYASPSAYLHNPAYFGALIGRYANRIAAGRFVQDGTPYSLDINDGPNHLHGGHRGFDRVVWNARPFTRADACGLVLTYISPDGEGGYPGTVHVRVTYTLTDRNEWIVDYQATTDHVTPINLTQHTYFNLAGAGTVCGHHLEIRAEQFLPVDKEGIPIGAPVPVAGTPFDFTRARAIGARIEADHPQIVAARGYDHCFVLDPTHEGRQPAARLTHPASGRVLSVYTTEPGVQLYTGNDIGGLVGKHGRPYRPWEGVCLETQHFPDTPNRPTFPGTLLQPGEVYTSQTIFAFSTQPNP